MWTWRSVVVVGLVLGLSTCASQSRPNTQKQAAEPPAGMRAGGIKMTITVTSSAFENGQPIPRKYAYAGEGDNISPPLQWTGAPDGVASYALICDDPDAPSPRNPRRQAWVHWVLWNIPGDKTGLAEGDRGAAVSGTSDFGKTGWGGPLPPPNSGKHRYFFKVYALDTTLELKSSATKADLKKAMEGHILAEGELHGTYERK